MFLSFSALFHSLYRFPFHHYCHKVTYGKVISVLSTLPVKITRIDQLYGSDGKRPRYFGQKTFDKIKEILDTGRLEKLEELLKDRKVTLTREFCRIWGVGAKKADEMMKQGFKSIEDLRKVRLRVAHVCFSWRTSATCCTTHQFVSHGFCISFTHVYYSLSLVFIQFLPISTHSPPLISTHPPPCPSTAPTNSTTSSRSACVTWKTSRTASIARRWA